MSAARVSRLSAETITCASSISSGVAASPAVLRFGTAPCIVLLLPGCRAHCIRFLAPLARRTDRSRPATSNPDFWIEGVEAGQLGLAEHLPADRREHVRPLELAAHAAFLHAERVEREYVVMHDLVVPR